MDEDSAIPPLTLAEDVLKNLAPELAPHVHAFLHGGRPGTLAIEPDWSGPSTRLRRLHEALSEAMLQRKPAYHCAVLSTAVRLQAVVVYEACKRHHGGHVDITY